ncbi:RNA 2',3'-cyclic phosphodiesterase [bacterium]|nr:RNA 2',3'-cyclic phosphodiesterase [bacterium]
MQSIRLFLAINLNSGTLNKLSKTTEELKSDFRDARWCKKNAMHLTIKFFGVIPLLSVVEIGKAVKSVVEKKEPISFEVKGVGGFPSLENPRILWAGITEGKEEIVKLAQDISDALEEYDFIPERKNYVPHITLARFKRGSKNNNGITSLSPRLEEKSFGVTKANELLLYSSDLIETGPFYSVVDRWTFGN